MSARHSANHIVQQQFGDKADAYAASSVHARGASLQRMVQLVEPQSDWTMLDVATGAGHTAHAFAPLVRVVLAADVTPSMAAQAGALAEEKGLHNVEPVVVEAAELPFASASLRLVTCRLAAHHFPNIGDFLQEAGRVLMSNGFVAITDNVVPGNRLRGKKGRRQQQVGEYVNALERLRDPSHVLCLSVQEWRDLLVQAGFVILHEEQLEMPLDFDTWASRMNVPKINQIRLRTMLKQAPEEVLEFLTPQFQGDRIEFHLSEALIVGKKTR